MFCCIQKTSSGQYIKKINKISYCAKLLKVLLKSKFLYQKILLIKMLKITIVITFENTYKSY